MGGWATVTSGPPGHRTGCLLAPPSPLPSRDDRLVGVQKTAWTTRLWGRRGGLPEDPSRGMGTNEPPRRNCFRLSFGAGHAPLCGQLWFEATKFWGAMPTDAPTGPVFPNLWPPGKGKERLRTGASAGAPTLGLENTFPENKTQTNVVRLPTGCPFKKATPGAALQDSLADFLTEQTTEWV